MKAYLCRMNEKHYCVIMGGGIGSRFWPVSRESKPKQFLDFFGKGRTLLQETFARVARFVPKENIFIVTNKQYAEETLRQLPELVEGRLLLEPVRRNTAPCIAYASYKIRAICPDAAIFVTPSDHLILDEERFTELAEKAMRFVRHNDYLLTLGIMATRPETGYGYIQRSAETIDGFHKVKVFTEKPTAQMAEMFLKSGDFLWNSGMFVWNVATICHALRRWLPDIHETLEGGDYLSPEGERKFIEEAFPTCSSISIDYGLMEKANNVLVLPSDFGWADLGTWGAIYEQAPKDNNRNAALSGKVLFSQASGNLVTLSDPSRVAVVDGIEDCIIAEHENVLLVCRRGEEYKIKGLMTDVAMNYGKEYI